MFATVHMGRTYTEKIFRIMLTNNKNIKPDDASHVYRAYRKQILFILHKILTSPDEYLVFCPEGLEDLSIEKFNKDEAIYQIKDNKYPLALNDLVSEKGTSFFTRASTYFNKNQTTEIILASYGTLGKELKEVSEGYDTAISSVVNKINSMGIIPYRNIEPLVKKIVFQNVSEEQIIKEITNVLSVSMLGLNTEVAINLLCWWIFKASENRLKITKSKILEEINKIGVFIKERSYHHEWLGSIVSFTDLMTNNRDTLKLTEQYKHGISASILHIQEGLDVSRGTKHEQIKIAFEDSNIVIIHGASGQGKTSLAYRYFYDNFPQDLSYQIREPVGREHSYSISEAIIQHHKAFQIPMFLYYDILPSDKNWPAIIERISHEKEIKILITIREEDWRKDSKLKEKISFKELELDFSRDEAEQIFNNIQQDTFLDFESSWQRFGGKGPLLEYIYFLNFGEKLEDRLQNQVKNITDKDTIAILRIIILITSYEARVVVKNIKPLVDLTRPDLLLESLNKEYLIRISENGNLIEGFHPIRSNIISKYLFDETFSPWIDVFYNAFLAIYEKDLGTFLLYCFSRRNESDIKIIIEVINSFSPVEWNTYDGIIKSLLWLGVKQYADKNRHLVDELKEKYPYIDIPFGLDTDIAGVAPDLSDNLINMYDELGSGTARVIEDFRKRQSDKDEVFILIKRWLSMTRNEPGLPVTENDYFGLSRYAFWLGYFKYIVNIFDGLYKVIDKDIDKLDIYVIAEIANGFIFLKDKKMQAVLKSHEGVITNKFLRVAGSLYIEKTKEMVKAHYIIPLSDNEKNFITSDKENNNAKSMAIIELMQKLYPKEEFYSTQGYGHSSVIEAVNIPKELMNDGSYKKIPRKNLPHPYLVDLNSTLIGYLQYKYRPSSWKEYIDRIIELRKMLLDSFERIIHGLDKYYRKRNLHDIINESTFKFLEICNSEINKLPAFPKIAVDEWGFVREGIAKNQYNSQTKTDQLQMHALSPALLKYDKYRRAFSDLFNHSSIIINQMAALISTRIKGKDEENMLSSLNLTDLLNFLSIFQKEFSRLFSVFVKNNELSNIEERENKIYSQLFSLWLYFSFHPDQKINNPIVDCNRYVKKTFKSEFLNKFAKELNSIDNFNFELVEIKVEDRDSICVITEILDFNKFHDNAENLIFVLGGLHISCTFNRVALDYNKEKIIRLLKYHWEDVCFVIKYKNRILFNILRRQNILSSLLNNDAPFLISNVDESFLEKRLNLSLGHSTQIDSINKFYQNYAILKLYLSHIKEVIIPVEKDDIPIDEVMLNEYFQRQTNEIAKSFQNINDSFVDLCNIFEKIESEDENSLFCEAFAVLIKIFKQIFPEPERETDGKFDCKLDIKKIKDWSQRIDSLYEDITNAYFMILIDGLQRV